jgi:hypothetical protein
MLFHLAKAIAALAGMSQAAMLSVPACPRYGPQTRSIAAQHDTGHDRQ